MIRDKLNNSLNYYLIKIIQLNKKKANNIYYICCIIYISWGL